MHGCQQVVLANLADAWPLRVPAVGAVIAVASLWQTEDVPFAALEKHEQDGLRIPAHGPDRGIRGVSAAFDAIRAGNFGELVAM